MLLFLCLTFNLGSDSAPVLAFQAGADRAQPLTLAAALSRVLDNNLELSLLGLEIQAAAARVLQAGLRPNPEISGEAENFLSMGGNGLFRNTESSVQLSQRFELGGKRAARVRAMEKDQAVAGGMLELKRADLVAATSLAFAQVLAGQERLANQQELSRLAQQAHLIVVERVAAGKVSPVEQTRATVALASAKLEEEKQFGELTAAKDRLSALWGGTHLDFDRARGIYEIPDSVSQSARSCIDNAPDMKLADAAVDSRRSALELEQASRKPDLTISAGIRRFNLEDQSGWVAGASIPLPIFDKRQGAIAEAKIRVDKALTEKKALAWRLRAGLAQARHDREIALLEAKTLTQTAIPAAREALAAVEEGYRYGKFDFLNVLDAQRTYAELHRRYIEAVAAGLKASIDIERLARCDSPPKAEPRVGEMKEVAHEE